MLPRVKKDSYIKLVCNNKFCFFIEEMSFFHIECKFDRIACLSGSTRINSGCYLSSVYIEVQEYFGAKKLVYFNYRGHWLAWRTSENHEYLLDGYP